MRFSRLGPPTCRTVNAAGQPCACYSRLRTRVANTRQRSRDLPSSSKDSYRRARRAGLGQRFFVSAFPNNMNDGGNTAVHLFVVFSPHGSRVRRNRQNPSTGSMRPVTAWHRPLARDEGSGSTGFLPALAPTTRSGPPVVDWLLRPANAVGWPGHVRSGDVQPGTPVREQALQAGDRAKGSRARV